MQEEHLAIASVPCQKWGELYEEKEALEIGTVFRELNKPFFAAQGLTTGSNTKKTLNEQEQLFQRICEISFVLDDLTLYLDTHTGDRQALEIFTEKTKERTSLKKEFAEKFYPLTRDCVIYCGENNEFSWQNGPVPWEGVCL